MIEVKLKKYLEDRGLFKVKTNYPGLSVYSLETETSACILCVVEKEAVEMLNADLYAVFTDKISAAYKATKSSINLLTLFLTGRLEDAKCIGGQNAYWIVDETYGRVVVYENQPEDFLGLRKDIEAMISMLKAEEQQRENEELTRQMKAEGAYVHTGPEYEYKLHKDYSRGNAAGSRRFSVLKTVNGNYPYVTVGLIAVNVFLLLLINLFGDLLGISDWLDAGAVSWMEAYEKHEYYRFITAMFLHADIGHIAGNMIVLFATGEILERMTGHLKFFAIYMLGGIIGGIGSVFYHYRINEYVQSIGASGAVYSVVGGILMYMVLNRDKINMIGFNRLAVMAVYMIYSGLASESTDNAAHIAGFLGGGLVYLVIYTFFEDKTKRKKYN